MISVRVPASTANLGPAFDVAALAVDLQLRASAHFRRGGLRLRVAGTEAPTHDGLAKRIRKGIALVAPDPDALDLDVVVTNDIPLGRGLGSSAAALVCGAALAAAALDMPLDPMSIVRLAAREEGHADNVAAAVFGGVCFVAGGAAGNIDRGAAGNTGRNAAGKTDRDSAGNTDRGSAGNLEGLAAGDAAKLGVHRIPVSPALRLAIIVPSHSLATNAARQALPPTYGRADLVFNLQNVALLAAAFAGGDLSLLRTALRDRIHQRFRAALSPGLADALAVETGDALGIVLSGAGPSVLVMAVDDPAPAAAEVARAFARAGVEARVLFPPSSNDGLCVAKSDRAASEYASAAGTSAADASAADASAAGASAADASAAGASAADASVADASAAGASAADASAKEAAR